MRKFISFVSFSMNVLALLYFLLVFAFSFNFKTQANQQYFLSIFPGVLSLCFLMCLFRQRPSFLSGLLCWLLIVLCCLLGFSKFFSFSNEYFLTIAVIVLLFIVAGLIAGNKFIQFILVALTLAYIAEIIIGLRQINNGKGLSSRLTGTLQNSGVYACYIVTGTPFFYYSLFHLKIISYWRGDKNRIVFFHNRAVCLLQNARFILWIKRLLFVLVIIFFVFTLYYTQSRSAILGFIAVIVALIVLEYGSIVTHRFSNIPKPFLFLAGGLLISLSSFADYYLFHLKKLSAFGRVMKWDIAWQHISEHFWLGTGLGRLTWYYPQWQAQYFQTNINPPREYFLSAGESYILFNEWLQLFVEVGFVGFTLFIAMLVYFFRSKSRQYGALLNAAKATVIAILVSGFTSYPLHVNVLVYLLVFCFFVAVVVRQNKTFLQRPIPIRWLPIFKLVLILLILLSLYTSYQRIHQLIAVNKWNNLRDNYALSRPEAKAKYAAIYPSLKHDGKFLTEHGEWLSKDRTDCKKAVVVLERAKKYFISRKTVETIGYAYWQLKNYPKAIENFEWLSNYLPNRFRPKYELLKLYKEAGDTANVMRLANVILTMPVKIPSAEVYRIKQETKSLISAL